MGLALRGGLNNGHVTWDVDHMPHSILQNYLIWHVQCTSIIAYTYKYV